MPVPPFETSDKTGTGEHPERPTERLLSEPSAAVPLGIAHLDAELRVVWVNDTFCERMGLSAAAVEGRSLDRFFPTAVRASLVEHFTRLLRGKQADFSLPMPLVDAAGAENGCLVTVVSVHTAAYLTHADCVALVVVAPDTDTGAPLCLAPAPAALAEMPAHILEGVASGMSTQQLASRLGLSSHGVEYHITAMLRRLKVPNRSALVARAYALDILQPHCWPPRVRPRYTARLPVGGAPAPVGSGRRPKPGLLPTAPLADGLV